MTTPAMARRRAKEALAFAREHDEHRPSTMAALAALEEVFHYVETVELRLGQHFNGGTFDHPELRP